MSDLPAGWEWTTLGDLAAAEPRAITDGPFGSNLKSNHYTTSGARVIRLQNIGDGEFRDERAYIDLERFERLRSHDVLRGDLIIASLGEAPPRACIVPDLGGPALVKADCIRVRTSPHVLTQWALYALLAPATKAHAKALIKGVGRPRLGLGHIRELPVPLPPLAEQRRIVDVVAAALDGVEAGASSLRRSLLRIVTMERRVVAEALSGGDAARCGSAEPPEPDDGVAVRDGDLPSLPAEWRWARLHEIADVVGGVTKDAAKQSDPAVPLAPYLRVANVQRGHLDLDHVTEIRVAEAKVDKLALQPGDVLLNEGGDRDKLGRGWIWEGQIVRCIHQNHVFRARIRDGAIHPKLLAWHANGFGHWFEVNGKQSVNLASISLRTIKQLPVPVPPPGEQAAIVREIENRLAETARLREALLAAQAHATALRRSILADAFAGRLVPQDSTDEPASELLARIRAEHVAQPVAGRRGVRRASR